MNAFSAACLLLALAAPAVQAAEIVNIDWGKAQRFELQRSIEPGKVLEVCGPLASGQAVDWQFTASAPLAFNIHHHVGKQVHYAERRNKTKSLTMRFKPTETADYCWMWTAPEGEVVRLQLLLRY